MCTTGILPVNVNTNQINQSISNPNPKSNQIKSNQLETTGQSNSLYLVPTPWASSQNVLLICRVVEVDQSSASLCKRASSLTLSRSSLPTFHINENYEICKSSVSLICWCSTQEKKKKKKKKKKGLRFHNLQWVQAQ